MEYDFSLLLATRYYFSVAAMNDHGRGPFSEQNEITTNSTSKYRNEVCMYVCIHYMYYLCVHCLSVHVCVHCMHYLFMCVCTYFISILMIKVDHLVVCMLLVSKCTH